MPSKPGAAPSRARGCAAGAVRLCCAAAALIAGLSTAAPAAEPPAAMLLDRLCADTLRPNEDERLFGLISTTVRATIKYQGGVFSPDLIDDAVQEALGALIDGCPKFAAAPGPQRLGMAVELIADATIQRLHDAKAHSKAHSKAHYSNRQTEKATAADLSEELSSREIDTWLDALPARERTLALFLYASDLSRQQVAAATGLPPRAVADGFGKAKSDLLKYYREAWDVAPPPPIPAGPAMEYREAGLPLAELLKSDQAKSDQAAPARAHVTGISSDIYAGWSLLGEIVGLPPGRRVELDAPILLVPDAPGHKRMIAVALDEIGDPHDTPRRFLIKAYAIDADGEGAGLHDSFHLGATTIDNAKALATLHNRSLTSIEIARCLWYDYGTAGDPGLCRL